MKTIDQKEVRDVVLKALREFVGNQTDEEINEATDPLKDLGLDSEDGVDFACDLSEKFDFHIPDDVNPFVNDSVCRSRNVGEVVDLMCELLGKDKL